MKASAKRQNGILFYRTAACLLLFLTLSLSHVFAADREVEMFTKGYQYLFSFNPDMAAQTFREFLREFPRSSARDAAQFWLGKALIALGSYAEAEQMFLAISREFPESPFLSFIDNELAEVAKARYYVTGKGRSVTVPGAENLQSENERSATEKDRQAAQSPDERDHLISEAEKTLTEKNRTEIDADRRSELPGNADQKQHARDSLLLKITELEEQIWQKEAALSDAKKVQENSRREAEQERKIADALRADIARLSQIELIFKELWGSYEEVISDADQTAAILRENKITGYDKQPPEMKTDLPHLAEQSTAGEQSPLLLQEGQPSFQSDSAQNEILLIRGKTYTLPQIIHDVSASQHTIEKLGIQEPVWRTGNPIDDFINEQLLSEEAANSGAMLDEKKYQKKVSQYKLAADEADYLRKLMIIGIFIDKTYRDPAAELFIEILTVEYQNETASQKAMTAADLQKAAKSGISFEDIQKTHHESVIFSRMSVDEFTSRYRNKSQIIGKLNFLTEETAVMWSEKGYMVIKPITGHKQIDPFAELPKEEEDKIRSFLSGYIADLRKNM